MATRSTLPLHLGWQRLRAAFRGADLLVDLFSSQHPDLRCAPTPESVVGFLTRGLTNSRHSRARFFVHDEGEARSATHLVECLASEVPELDGLHLDVDRLRLVAGSTAAPLRPNDVGVDGAREGWGRYSVTVDGLVRAVNALLDAAGVPERFLPLDCDEGTAAYLAVEPPQAIRLHGADLWGEDLSALFGFAGWAEVTETSVEVA